MTIIKKSNFFKWTTRWIYLLTVVCICISPSLAMEIVMEHQDGDYLLVYKSDIPVIISGYTVQLEFDQKNSIIDVQSLEPFDLFAYHDNGEGILRISGITAQKYQPDTYIPLARIIAKSPFEPTVTIDSLRDYDLNVLVGQDIEKKPTDSKLADINPYPSSPVIPIATIPPEVRIPWTIPNQETVTMAPTSPTPNVAEENVENKIVTPNSLDDASTSMKVGNESTTIPNSNTDFQEKTIPTTPISIQNIIAGVVIAIFIKRNRVIDKLNRGA